MSPPTIGTPVQVRLPDQWIEDIDTMAGDLGLSRSAMVRDLIERGIADVTRKAARRGK